MKNLKIKVFGSLYQLAQLPRIIKGFELLSHKIIEEGEPDFIYSNDDVHFKEATEYKNKYKNAKLILNVLDLAFHAKNIHEVIQTLSTQLILADKVTTISQTVKKQLEIVFPFLQGKVDVIYQPIKDVYNLGLEREKRALVLGRQLDPNKNIKLAVESCAIMNLPLDVIGPENPRDLFDFGYQKIINYKGLILDGQLNEEYNKHAITFIMSNIEGLCLPLIESIVSLTPVVCSSSMSTANEFCPPEFICNPSTFDIIKKVEWIFGNKDKVDSILKEYCESYSEKFSKIQVARNIVEVFNKII